MLERTRATIRSFIDNKRFNRLDNRLFKQHHYGEGVSRITVDPVQNTYDNPSGYQESTNVRALSYGARVTVEFPVGARKAPIISTFYTRVDRMPFFKTEEIYVNREIEKAVAQKMGDRLSLYADSVTVNEPYGTTANAE